MYCYSEVVMHSWSTYKAQLNMQYLEGMVDYLCLAYSIIKLSSSSFLSKYLEGNRLKNHIYEQDCPEYQYMQKMQLQ